MAFLKPYQRDCVDAVEAYLRRTRELRDAKLAFQEDAARGPYHEPPGLEGLPYVCVKVPTGGGKTAIAAFCVAPLLSVMRQRDAGPVVWLAPSDKIVSQTIDALRDRSHPYRRHLDDAFGGRVGVYSLDAALSIRKGVLERDCVILVATVQSLRREKEATRIYRQNGEMLQHFTSLTPGQREALLLDAPEGVDPTSPTLANVLRMHKPVVVMDEAHNARTDLSFEALGRFGPSCVLELTATPATGGDCPSNVLVSVSAKRLKDAEMIKLPVMLRARTLEADAIRQAVEKREQLAELAKQEEQTHGHVRPVVLYQAAKGDSDFNPAGVKKVLVETLGIDEQKVAICTGAVDELPDLPMADPMNPIEHVITVQKLREGWDCPSAYVLCSVANLGSKTAVEQILGRVLRMPYAARRGHDALNRAYCYATSQSFQEAADSLVDAMVHNCGFEPHEARRLVTREPGGDGGLFAGAPEPVQLRLSGAFDRSKLPEPVQKHLAVQPASADGAETVLTWTGGPMDAQTAAAIHAQVSAGGDAEPGDADAAQRLQRASWREDASPAAVGRPFEFPGLAVRVDGQWELLEDQPAEAPWTLKTKDASLPGFLPKRSDTTVVEVDVNAAGKPKTRFLDELDRVVRLFDPDGLKTAAELVLWLHGQQGRVRERGITAPELQDWLHRVVEALVEDRGLEVGMLDRHKPLLRDAVRDRLAAIRRNAEATAYQQLLEGLPEGVSLGDEEREAAVHVLTGDRYPVAKLCEADFAWQRHYHETPGAMRDAELKVAKWIDSRPTVRHWLRNPDHPRHRDHAFFLRLPDGFFFPDFLVELKDGRHVAVEYKGDHLNEADQPKKRLGERWEARDPGRRRFVWARKDDWKGGIEAAFA